MKINNKLIALSLASVSMALMSCESKDKDFPDYEGGVSVYFPYQTPVRTLVLGSDEYDTTLDKAHKCKISATMGGAYKGRNIVVDIAVDNNLCKNVVYKSNGQPLKAMPENYYKLSGNQISFGGEMSGSIEVELSDAFFADPASISSTYVIPVVMLAQKGADQILEGSYDQTIYSDGKPARANSDAWLEKPMDYTFFCVKYQNQYTGNYSRCGKYSLNGGAEYQLPDESSAKYQGHFDPVIDGTDCAVSTVSLSKSVYNPGYIGDLTAFNCPLELSFDANGKCTISTSAEGFTVTGSGQFTAEGAKKAWGDKDRDLLVLEFTISNAAGKLSCKESLVWKRSGVKIETLDVAYAN